MIGDGRDGTLLWFGGGVTSAAQAVGTNIRIVHWDLDRGGFEAEKLPVATVRNVAQACVEMWNDSDARALWIGGFSYGALVAYECACLLAEQGAGVKGCILLDPPDIRDRTIAKQRWSAIRASFLLGLLSPVSRWFAFRIQRETRNARMATRRALMRRYSPSRSLLPAHLFTCAQNREPAVNLFSPIATGLSVVLLPVSGHMDVVRNNAAIGVWSDFLRAEVGRSRTIPFRDKWGV